MNWIKENYTEGGPIFIGDYNSFHYWKGGIELDNSWTAHFFGSAVLSLPEGLLAGKKDEWHQYKNFISLENADTYIRELIKYFEELYDDKDIKLTTYPGEVDFKSIIEKEKFNCKVLVNDEQVFSVEFSKSTHYGLMCQTAGDGVNEYGFENQKALFFNMEGDGDLSIAYNDDRSEISIFHFIVDKLI